MKKTCIILLAAFIMAASVFACKSLETGSSELSTGNQISENRYFSFTDIAGIKTYFFENRDWELCLTARQIDNIQQIDIMQNRQLMVQNKPPVFRRESPKIVE